MRAWLRLLAAAVLAGAASCKSLDRAQREAAQEKAVLEAWEAAPR